MSYHLFNVTLKISAICCIMPQESSNFHQPWKFSYTKDLLLQNTKLSYMNLTSNFETDTVEHACKNIGDFLHKRFAGFFNL
jgi:hypothetical protein